ncbi:MAG: glycosyltransferase family 4 protein [Desulfobaccales bacterium]
MRISFIYDCVYPFSKGGAEKRIFEYSSYLSTLFEVEILSMKWWAGKNNILLDNVRYKAIHRKASLFNKEGKRNTLPAIKFGIKTFFYIIKGKPDILDFEIFPYFPVIFATLAGFFKKPKPIIIGYWSECLGKNAWKNYSRSFWFIGAWLERICSWSCDFFIANSDFTRKRLEQFLAIPVQKITVVPPFGIDSELIFGIQKDRDLVFDLIYFGRLIQHKHVDMVIQLVADLKLQGKNIKALIIGNGPSEALLKDQVEKLGLSENILFLDFIDSYEKLISFIKAGKIYVLPSSREGFGISVIEANACGLPALVMDFPDNASKELVASGENGFVCRDYADLRNKVIYLISDSNYINFKDKSMRIAMTFSKDRVLHLVTNYYSAIKNIQHRK